jgi:hypothetical protein
LTLNAIYFEFANRSATLLALIYLVITFRWPRWSFNQILLSLLAAITDLVLSS